MTTTLEDVMKTAGKYVQGLLANGTEERLSRIEDELRKIQVNTAPGITYNPPPNTPYQPPVVEFKPKALNMSAIIRPWFAGLFNKMQLNESITYARLNEMMADHPEIDTPNPVGLYSEIVRAIAEKSGVFAIGGSQTKRFVIKITEQTTPLNADTIKAWQKAVRIAKKKK